MSLSDYDGNDYIRELELRIRELEAELRNTREALAGLQVDHVRAAQEHERVVNSWKQEEEDWLLEAASLRAELRKYEPSDGVMMQRLGDLQAIKEAAAIIEACVPAYPDVQAWLALPVVAQARKLP